MPLSAERIKTEHACVIRTKAEIVSASVNNLWIWLRLEFVWVWMKVCGRGVRVIRGGEGWGCCVCVCGRASRNTGYSLVPPC